MSFLDKTKIVSRAIQYHHVLLDIQFLLTHLHCKLECIKKRQKLPNYLFGFNNQVQKAQGIQNRPLTGIYAGRGRCALYTWSVFCRSDRAARGSSTESRSGRRTLRPHSLPSVGSVKTVDISETSICHCMNFVFKYWQLIFKFILTSIIILVLLSQHTFSIFILPIINILRG